MNKTIIPYSISSSLRSPASTNHRRALTSSVQARRRANEVRAGHLFCEDTAAAAQPYHLTLRLAGPLMLVYKFPLPTVQSSLRMLARPLLPAFRRKFSTVPTDPLWICSAGSASSLRVLFQRFRRMSRMPRL